MDDGDALAVAAALTLAPPPAFAIGNCAGVRLPPCGSWVPRDGSVWYEVDHQRLLRYVHTSGACVWLELA